MIPVTTFGNSPIWQLQQQYFEDTGINAWSKSEVPHYVTSNPVVAKAYAEMVYAFLCDLSVTHHANEKIYLLELGAGHGRFCYHFLKHLDQLTTNSGYSLPDFCYVLSDFSEGVLNYWKEHPRLQPFYVKGQLDHCLLNALDIQEITLRMSGKTIKKASLSLPIIVIANYFFDTIPQDLYFIRNNQVHECYVQTALPEDAADISVKERISNMILTEADKPLLQKPAYPEPFLNRIIEQFAMQSESDTYLLFPHTGLRCIDHLSQLSQHGLLLLTGDRGYHRPDESKNRQFPSIAIHGSFSYQVNYHAFKLYCADRGGAHFFPTHRHDSITHGCLMLLPDADRFAETKMAYQRFINNFGPDDFYTLKQLFVSTAHNLSLQELLACLRLSGYDARFFNQLLPRLTDLINSVSEEEKWDIFQVLHQIWEMYYPLGEEDDLAFNIGLVLFNLNFPKEALSYFLLSEKIYGYHANRSYNIAVCHYHLNDHVTALKILQENHTRTPGNELNNTLLGHLETTVMR
ncbi:MAG: SAM-dependent methyltransferase [Bacteroidota bacterium]